MAGSTQNESVFGGPTGRDVAVPGAVLVYSGNAPQLRAFQISTEPLLVHRDQLHLTDGKVSRPHAIISFDGPGWTVKDLGSKNGTAVGGKKLEPNGEARAASGNVVRTGHSLFVLYGDVRRFLVGDGVTTDRVVVGPTLRAELDRVALEARANRNVLLGGENGVGKEIAAGAFHRATGRSGSFVAINCAELVETLAEAQLFGMQREIVGSGKGEREGLVQTANGGTLFLDEVGELHLEVQAKLLRLIENRVVTRVGATREEPVDIRIVAATNRDLRKAVQAGTFRQDLFYRLAQVEVRIPSLRERREEIPWLIDAALREEPVRVAHVSLVEAALLRPWPGNVRDLLVQIKVAAAAAGRAKSDSVRLEHLADRAGEAFGAEPAEPRAVRVADTAPAGGKKRSREELVSALESTGWVISKAAKQLGLHRTQLIRDMEKHGIARPKTAAAGDAPDDDGDAED